MTSAAMLTAMRTTRHSVRHMAPEPAGLHLRTRAWNESWYTLANQRNRTTRGGKSSVLPVHLWGAALKSGGSAQNESKFSVISSRRQPSGRRDGFRLTPLRMCSCGRGLARACLLVLPWSVCLGRPAESRARPGRAHSAAETAIPVALVVDFRALQVASNGLGASARS